MFSSAAMVAMEIPWLLHCRRYIRSCRPIPICLSNPAAEQAIYKPIYSNIKRAVDPLQIPTPK